MRQLWIALAFSILAAAPSANGETAVSAAAHPEAELYFEDADATVEVAGALTDAAATGKNVIIIMGGNWCHDSRALAGWFQTPRFQAMLEPLYEIVYVDAGVPQRRGEARNQDIIKRFGGKSQKNTPYVMVLSSGGKLLNKKDARSWRNAASRSADDIFDYFALFTGA